VRRSLERSKPYQAGLKNPYARTSDFPILAGPRRSLMRQLFRAGQKQGRKLHAKAQSKRSSRAEVRNPVLALPEFDRVRKLDPASRVAVRAVFLGLQAVCRANGDRCWRKRKPPMAAYWASFSVYWGHLARAIPKERRP